MTVGQRIKQRRLELGWTQTELAEKMGYSGKSAVCMAEKKGDNITTTKVRKFAEALGVSFRYLMGYEDLDGNPITSEQSLDYQVERNKREELYLIYKSLSPEKQEMFSKYLKFLQSDS